MFYLTQVLWADVLKIFSFNELCLLIKDCLVWPKIENGNRRTSQKCYSSVTWGDKSPNHKKTWKKKNPNAIRQKTKLFILRPMKFCITSFSSLFILTISSETEQQSYLIQVLGIDLLVIISKDVVNSDRVFISNVRFIKPMTVSEI